MITVHVRPRPLERHRMISSTKSCQSLMPAFIEGRIGYPGGLAPQPPHHPACGSARGGSQNLPSRSRVVDFHPQLFDRQKPLILKPLVGHASLSSQSPSQMPRAFTADCHEDGRLPIGAQLHEFAHLGARVAPLFPVANAHPPSESMIDLRDRSMVPRYLLNPRASLCCANSPGD